MTFLTETAPEPVIDVLPVANQTTTMQNVGVGLGLAVIAGESYYAEHTHISKEMVQPLRAVVESGAHPVLGFGAALAIMATQGEGFTFRDRVGLSAVVIAASMADIYTERMQDLIVQPKKPFTTIRVLLCGWPRLLMRHRLVQRYNP